jgi:uncharacterized damage-inducible protein DinB
VAVKRRPAAGRARVEPPVAVLLDLLDEAFSRKSWHGPNLRGALRGVSAREAGERPDRGRHNIRELAVHAAYWKYVVRRILTGEKGGKFVLAGSNWFARPEGADEAGWRADLALLDEEHRRLRETVAGASWAALRRPPRGKKDPAAHFVRGAAAHDLYHAGQIQLLKRLLRG